MDEFEDTEDLDDPEWLAHVGLAPKQFSTSERSREGTRFRLERMGTLQARPVEWLVRGLVERDSIAMVFSDPGAGKSFLAIDLAACVATGTPFHGLTVSHGPAIYIAGEGANGLARRRMAWEIEHERSLADELLFVSRSPAALCSPISANEVCVAVDSVAEQHGPPALVVIDTVARNFGPGDENSTQHMNGFVSAIDLIRANHCATVLLVHHTGHADKSRPRGAMALHGALDASYRLDKDKTGVIRIEAVKMKDAPIPEPLAFRLHAVNLGLVDEEGQTVTSAVLRREAYAPVAAKNNVARGKRQQTALNALETAFKRHRSNLTAGGRNPDTARVSVNDWRLECMDIGIPNNRFYEVKKSLEATKCIVVANGFVYLP
jgi:hypothetical protein